MKQIIQDLKTGETILEEVPVPMEIDGHVLIKTKKTLVSLGTEKMLVSFGKANFFQKARQQPDKVKEVIQKIKTDGIKPTIEAVFRKLGQPLPLGYCNFGEVVGIGNNVENFKIGDRVVSNGHHAEFVNIPSNLVSKVPNDVDDDQAVFTIVASIGLQGVRLIKPTFGETIVVSGLGLIGLITIQILKSNGCNVVGFDYDEEKVDLAKSFGISAYDINGKNPVKIIEDLTNGNGADGVIITASTKSNELISQSAQMCRKRGRVVLVGVIGLNINRADFYEKEITFQVSCSYGPGRYDQNYEQDGLDYPIGYVRWTEKRNFEAVLNAISNGLLNFKPLISQEVPIEDYQLIYTDISNTNSIASIINFNNENENISSNLNTVTVSNKKLIVSKPVIGVIGAGNFTSSMILPVLNKLGVQIKYIASSKGLSGTVLAKKYNINFSTSDYKKIIHDNEINATIITTKHNSHAKLVVESLSMDKHVFVEKPLAISSVELQKIKKSYEKSKGSLMVGFNRRFSPLTIISKELIGLKETPINVIATMNAGYIPKDSWVQDLKVGGGRIIGEACHYIDLISFLTSSKVKAVTMSGLGQNPSYNSDNAIIILKYENGSQGVINYFANGNKSYPKERIEIFDSGKNIIIDNFRKISFYGYSKTSKKIRQDKGHYNQFKNWIHSIKSSGSSLIKFDEIINTTKASFAAIDSLKNNSWISIE
tara:strand:+ start:17784 stop:19910 length:2127 start_codon:yes stop_codon:yes gene_type:complete